jgi:tetratricopeptide (TPR) repeat protein
MIRKRKLLTFGLLIALSALIAGFAFHKYSEAEGYRILVEHGPAAAVEYFAEAQAASDGDNLQSIWYGYAWSNFKSKKYGVAEDYCQRILGNHPDARRRADVFYLLGYIYLGTGRHFMANLRFSDAIEIYRTLENQQSNVHRSELGLVRVFIEGGNYDEAEKALDRAAKFGGKLNSLSEYYQLRTILAFKIAEYRRALKYARLSLDDAKSDEVLQAHAYIDISFYSLLMGDFEAGFKYHQLAQRLIVKNGLEDLKYSNMLNMILYSRCSGESYDSLVAEIEQRIRIDHNTDFQVMQEFVLNWECGRVVE